MVLLYGATGVKAGDLRHCEVYSTDPTWDKASMTRGTEYKAVRNVDMS